MTQSYLGDNLFTLRKQKGISQDEFAEKLGVSRQAVSKWERNEAYPDTENLIAISRFYNVTIDDLINKSLGNESPADVVGSLKSPVPSEIDDFDEEDEDDDDDYDEDDGDNEEGENSGEKKRGSIWYSIPYPIVITVVYLLLGFLVPRGWEVGWTLYVTVPIYYSLIDCIRHKSFTRFAYPVFVTFVFLLLGMLYGIWHPLWIIYLTIPIYYPIAAAIDKSIHKNH